MRIAQAEGEQWKDETLTYNAVCRATPHSMTGLCPAELLFRWKVQRKIPQLNTEDLDPEIQDHDAEKKGLSKVYADQKRDVTDLDIIPGDTVLLRHEQTGKLDTVFVLEPLQAVEKLGSRVTVESPEGAKSVQP